MKRKPSGPRYRNLTVRNGVIYYQRRFGKHRIKLSTKTGARDETEVGEEHGR